ncbi:MAG: hypothetical protein GX558_09635, partial [Clostridiales bacterium]|nr:hypothetical protein [Clostridiales bacterium]
MAIRFATGRADAVRRRLTDELRAALAAGGEGANRPMLLIVPEQYTLQAEIDLMDELDLDGSFRFQVLSPARLVSRIFAEAGRPPSGRIDDRGRAVMMYLALQSLAESLTWYRGSQHWPGFAQLMVEQVREFKQSGQTADKLQELAEEQFQGALRGKLIDIAAIWRAYDLSLGGQYADDDDELNAALSRAPQAAFLADADVWVHGFETISAPMARMLIALSGCAASVTMMLVLENDGNARDFRAFQPVQDAYERTLRRLDQAGVARTRTCLPSPNAQGGEIAHCARELWCYPPISWPERPRQLQLAALQNPLAEAMFAAALSRQLVMRQGWRWRDVKVVLGGLDGYQDALERAFALYEVPLFLEGGRIAARHPVAEYLLLSMRLAIFGFQPGDAHLLMRTGYTDLDDDECDLLIQYAAENGLRGSAWTRPLTRGGGAAIAAAEPLRERLAAPVVALRGRLAAARGADEQLKAVWQLMEDARAHEKLEADRARMAALNRPLRANEAAQVWNRLVGAIDQMHALLGGARVPARDLYELIRQSLMASEIKPLPQSADAVEAGSLNRLRGHPVKALILLGMSDDGGAAERGAFLPAERAALVAGDRLWLHPDAGERQMLGILDLKAALSLAEKYVVVTHPMSGPAGEPRQPGALVSQMKRIFPLLSERGGALGELNIEKMLLSAPGAALERALPAMRAPGGRNGVARAAYRALLASPNHRLAAEAAGQALHCRVGSEPLPPSQARRLYGGPSSVSASRLELYAGCPFRHFVKYGLRPIEPREYEFTPENRGSFLHEALDRYAKATDVAGRDIERSLQIMDQVTDELLKPLIDGPLGEDPVTLAYGRRLKRIARRTARLIAAQFEGGEFEQLSAESAFSRFDPAELLGEPL